MHHFVLDGLGMTVTLLSIILLIDDDGLGIAVLLVVWMFSLEWNGRWSWNV